MNSSNYDVSAKRLKPESSDIDNKHTFPTPINIGITNTNNSKKNGGSDEVKVSNGSNNRDVSNECKVF